ncbi:FecR domain-containing protein [Aquincola sp. S2]|uniref:FecR domain-containing protein n=1 Tax=Pseudaquabacterium terrae TaxID=2732868 RepID=A0ABX2EDV7_9BURK|nr:FecR family protein [Aquabacterium terrae]NRF66801.1 FecR domain-containing protein [Aquabacterium terrae]
MIKTALKASGRSVAGLVSAFTVCAVAAAQPQAVGHVSLVIGAAHVVRADGARESLRRGASIMVGDRLETTANGHVHVRFVDNGAVSVRPESVLEVQSYKYDTQNPALNEVKLRLDQGTSRSISGAATEADKSRFRLNTPIAAIGVRGTDFIVQSDLSGVRATVADGAIVIGPLSADCTTGTLGPCAGEAARVLSAGMGGLMAEVRAGESRTRLVPAAGTVLATVSAKRDEANGQRPQGETLTYSVNDRTGADLLTIASDRRILDPNRPADLTAQLVWGRWTEGASPNDKIAVPEWAAAVGRHYTGIGNGDIGLFRANQTQPGNILSDSLNATAEFKLTRAYATYERGGKSEMASVDNGTLVIDFARRSFSTFLPLASASGGSAEVRAGGIVRSNGTFAVRDSEQLVAGVVSTDGKEAGYLFERSAAGGWFKGRTLWGVIGGR